MIDPRRRLRHQVSSIEREKLVSLGRVSAAVCHEIKNPIGAIVFSAETALRLVGQAQSVDRLRECLTLITQASHRCKNLVKGTLSFAYGDGKDRSFTDLNSIVDTAIRYAQMTEHGVDLEVRMKCSPDLPPVLVNELAIEIALVNLIQNAAHASPHDSPVIVQTRLIDDGVEVAVIDEGVGIPEEHLPKIWQPRFTSRGESGGNGLGLSLVREIVTSHDARITVESEVGIGSTFRIVFPTSV